MPGFLSPPGSTGGVVPTVPVSWRLPAEPVSARRARRAVAEVLPDACRSELLDDVVLLVSELVTNAVRHGARSGGGDVVEVVAWPADGHYWLAVSDPGEGLPVRVPPGHEACGGRGLVLVDTLCATWAVVPRRTRGKSVVAGIRLDRG